MKKYVLSLLPLLFAGCLGSAPKAPVKWTVDADTRLAVSAITVAAPYDGTRLAVMRSDGSLAFDAYNVFADRPRRLLEFAVKPEPSAPAILVRRFALDCREEGERKAYVVIRASAGGRESDGEGVVNAQDGNYTRAFSAAFGDALRSALKGLK